MATQEESSFERLISELEAKCGLSREKISNLIGMKKATIGGGYLTDRGALFLVAADLGITLDYVQEKSVSIAKLSRDSSASLICRILSFGPPKSFMRKSDSRPGALVRATLYDDSGMIAANFWDKTAIRIAQSDEFRPGALLKISNAYLRPGLDGSLVLNIGESVSLESINEVSFQRVKTISDQVRSLASLPENGGGMIVGGIVDGDVKKFSFSRGDGSSSEYTSFYVCDGQDRNLKRRVVLWGFSNPAVSLIKHSDSITLVNVRSKLVTFQNTNSSEIHGDDTTIILEHWDETKEWLKQCVEALDGLNEPIQPTGGISQTVLPFVARVASIRKSDDKIFALLIDSKGKKISATIAGDAVNRISDLRIDTLLICRPDTQDIESGKATFTKNSSLVASQSKRKDVPTSKSLVTSVEQLGQAGIVSLDVMCLTDTIERDIQTKEGLVRRSELTVADHTGEIKVYGWRALSKLLESYSAGDRILISAAEIQTHEGKRFIVLRNYTDISRNAA